MEKRTKYHNDVIRLKEMIVIYKEKGTLTKELKDLIKKQEEMNIQKEMNRSLSSEETTRRKQRKIPKLHLESIVNMNNINTPQMNKYLSLYNKIESDSSYYLTDEFREGFEDIIRSLPRKNI